MRSRFLIASLLFILSAGLQLFVKSIFGFWVSFIFASLVAFSLSLPFLELMLFVVAAAFFINWQPVLNWEIAVFTLVPLIFFLSKEKIHWQPWFFDVIAVSSSLIVIYLVFGFGFIVNSPKSFILDLVISAIFSLSIFATMSFLSADC